MIGKCPSRCKQRFHRCAGARRLRGTGVHRFALVGLTLEDIRRGVSRLQGGYALESCGSFFTLAISLAALERLT
jgi:hypothetical protein